MKINPRTGKDLYHGGRERLVQEALVDRLKTGMVFYDLGANLGLFTLIGARCVGPDGKVFAFEPDPDVCGRLRENVSRNGFSNVEIVQAAVCSTTGSTDFVRADPEVSPELGLGRIHTGHVGYRTIRVQGVTLKDFAQKAPLPDVVKCDVEGAEVEVFGDSEFAFERQRPVIVCEVHSKSGADGLRVLLSNVGYTIRDLDNNHILAFP